MPQLRDSGNDVSPVEASNSAEYEGFDRIFGIETEYGLSVTGCDRPLEAGKVAMAMFQPVVSRARSTNTYLANGARLYLDVGSHPEYATAEARDPLDALAQDLAGERMMRRLAQDAQGRLRATHGEVAMIHVFKNNVDAQGHSFGCHENYLVRRFVALDTIERELLPFLITRQLFTGAGRVISGAPRGTADPDRAGRTSATGGRDGDIAGFELSQRADYLDEAVSSATTRSRPMVNTRDEPHANPNEFRRLHVIIGDSNRSQYATMMKLATTHLVLCVIEHARRRGVPSGFEPCALADPAGANRSISRDLTCRSAELTMVEAGEWGKPTALEVQRHYCEIVEAFVNHESDDLRMSVSDCRMIVDQWQQMLDTIASGKVMALADRVDWVAKYRLFQALAARYPDTPRTRFAQIDMDYHDVANGTTYEALLRRNAIRRLVSDDAIARASICPPNNTRAALRGAFVDKALHAGAQFSCDWTHVTLASPQRLEALLLDPFGTEADEAYARVMRALD